MGVLPCRLMKAGVMLNKTASQMGEYKKENQQCHTLKISNI